MTSIGNNMRYWDLILEGKKLEFPLILQVYV
jgi:hypothetical protein